MFQGRSFLKLQDYTPHELDYLIDFSIHLKKLKKNRIPHQYLLGQNICLVFEKSSTRTRAAFTVAANDLGAKVEFFGGNDIQLGNKESTEDTARILGSMFDGIEFRGFKQEDVEGLAEFSGVPVWNGLTDTWHPTQMLADFMTVKEEFGTLQGQTLVYCGDGRNNVANSLLIAGAMLGVNVRIASPKALFPDEVIVQEARVYAEESGAEISVTEDIQAAVTGATVIYTDVWVSMGEEGKYSERIELLLPYQVNQALFDLADSKAIFMHCLPAFHDTNTSVGQYIAQEHGLDAMEVTDEVFRAPYGRQFEQGENRLHTIKAIMAVTNGNLFIPKV